MNIKDWTSKSEKDGLFEPVMKHLLLRIEEDSGLLADSEGKTWDNCSRYIMDKARKQAQNGCAVIRDEQVYEWAEDYCRMTDEEYAKFSEKKTPTARVQTAEVAKPDMRVVKPADEQMSLFGGGMV